jgi:hypothetical protein
MSSQIRKGVHRRGDTRLSCAKAKGLVTLADGSGRVEGVGEDDNPRAVMPGGDASKWKFAREERQRGRSNHKGATRKWYGTVSAGHTTRAALTK